MDISEAHRDASRRSGSVSPTGSTNLPDEIKRSPPKLIPEEAAVNVLLQGRLRKGGRAQGEKSPAEETVSLSLRRMSAEEAPTATVYAPGFTWNACASTSQ